MPGLAEDEREAVTLPGEGARRRPPLAALAASLIILLQLIGPSNASGGVGALPAIGAIIPALVANWLRLRNAPGAG